MNNLEDKNNENISSESIPLDDNVNQSELNSDEISSGENQEHNRQQAEKISTDATLASQPNSEQNPNIPIYQGNNGIPDNSVEVDTHKREKKKFRLGRFILKWLIITLVLAVAIVALYLKFSQINYMKYQANADYTLVSQLFKAREDGGVYEAKISTTNFNKLIANSQNDMELPLDLAVSNIFYDSSNANFILNADNSWISTSFILNLEYIDGKPKILNVKLGTLGIPFNFVKSFINLSPMHDQIHQSGLIDIIELNFSNDGVYVKYKLNENSLQAIKRALKSSQRTNIVEYANIKKNQQLNQIIAFAQGVKLPDSISDEDFVLKLLSDRQFAISTFATLDKNSRKNFADKLLDELGFKEVLDREYFDDLINISDDKYAFYIKDIEVERLRKSLEDQTQSYEQIKEEKATLVEKLDTFILPEVATWNSIKASSEYNDGQLHFKAKYLDDNDDMTYWATLENNGLGETISFESATSYSLSKIKLKNGITSDKQYYDNNRIQRLLLEFSNGNSKIIDIDDKNNVYQEFPIDETDVTSVKITILKVKYGKLHEIPGNKALTGITELHFELKKQL